MFVVVVVVVVVVLVVVVSVSFFFSDAPSLRFSSQVERQGERLSYSKISGNGPAKGWVSISLKGRALLEPQTESTTKIESDWA